MQFLIRTFDSEGFQGGEDSEFTPSILVQSNLVGLPDVFAFQAYAHVFGHGPQVANLRLCAGLEKSLHSSSSAVRSTQSDFRGLFRVMFPLHGDHLFKSPDPIVVY
jgi:hypothetical protein